MRPLLTLGLLALAVPLQAEPCNPYNGCVPSMDGVYFGVVPDGPGSRPLPLDTTMLPPDWYTRPGQPEPAPPALPAVVASITLVRLPDDELTAFDTTPADVPEPSLLTLLGLGGLVWVRRRRA